MKTTVALSDKATVWARRVSFEDDVTPSGTVDKVSSTVNVPVAAV